MSAQAGTGEPSNYLASLVALARLSVTQLLRPPSHSRRAEAARRLARHAWLATAIVGAAIASLMYWLDAREIALAPLDRQSVRPQNCLNGRALAQPDLTDKAAPRPHQPADVGRERPITGQPVRAAIEGTARVIEGDLAR